MGKRFLIYVLLMLSCLGKAQTKETLEKYISNNLSYQHLKYKAGGKETQINIYQIEFKNCTVSYPLYIKKGDKTERFTVRILLSGTNDIVMTKSKDGFYVITFTTNGKSILKEYPDGALIHEKKQMIPLKKYDSKALEYFKKLKNICEKKST